MTTTESITFSQSLIIPETERYLYITPLDTDNKPGEMLIVTHSADYIYNMVDTYKDTLYTSIPFVIILALLSGYLLSGYFLRQVKAISATAEKIDPANIIDRIPVKSNDELGAFENSTR
jgi:HAMP domain-containing protein